MMRTLADNSNSLAAHPQYNETNAYDVDNGWLALGGLDGTVKVWDVAARQSLVTFNAGSRGITAMAFSPDGTQLATANQDGTLQVWDWQNKASVAQFQATVSRLVFSPDGAQLAAGEETRIEVWKLGDGTLVYSLATGPGGSSDVLTYSPDGDYLLNGGGIPSVTVWDTTNGQLVNTLPGVGGDATSVAFTPDGNLVATAVLGGAVSLWDMTKIREDNLARGDLSVGTRQILDVDWSTDGYLLLLFDATGPIQVWGIPAAEATPEGS